MPADYQPPPSSWVRKFACALSGIVWAARTQSSCYVHLALTLLVLAAAAYFRLTATHWCLLVLSVAAVWSAELMNTAIEQLAKQVDRRENRQLGQALDIASGAVLCMAIGAAVVGLIVLVPYVIALF